MEFSSEFSPESSSEFSAEMSMDEILETGRTIRLGCFTCDRCDYEYITEDELAAAVADGWEGVREIQSLEDSLDTESCANLLDWETHRGICPDCLRKGG